MGNTGRAHTHFNLLNSRGSNQQSSESCSERHEVLQSSRGRCRDEPSTPDSPGEYTSSSVTSSNVCRTIQHKDTVSSKIQVLIAVKPTALEAIQELMEQGLDNLVVSGIMRVSFQLHLTVMTVPNQGVVASLAYSQTAPESSEAPGTYRRVQPDEEVYDPINTSVGEWYRHTGSYVDHTLAQRTKIVPEGERLNHMQVEYSPKLDVDGYNLSRFITQPAPEMDSDIPEVNDNDCDLY